MRGGRRIGAGRRKGSKSKSTIEREQLIEQTAARHDPSKRGDPLAKEVVEQFMLIAAGYASKYQPGKPEGDEKKFLQWAKLAVEWAAELAPYQSPKFRAIVIAGAPAQKIIEFAKDARVQLEYLVAREIDADGEGQDALTIN